MRLFLFSLILFMGQMVTGQTASEICPIPIGSELPKATVVDHNGNSKSIFDICEDKKTVLIFYRGGWCPYCTKHLSAVQEIENEIGEMGYQIVAIGADMFTYSNETSKEFEIPYKLYSDSKGTAAEAFGISFIVDDKTFKRYKNDYDIDLEKLSNETHHRLPVPSIFVVENNKISFEYVNPEYKTRISKEMLLAALGHQEETEKPSPEHDVVLNCLEIITSEKRDWDAFRKLFIPTADFTVVTLKQGKKVSKTFSVEEFIKMAGIDNKGGAFTEKEVSYKIDSFNGIAQIFQTYESNHSGNIKKGINSYHLVDTMYGWKIANVIWSTETPSISIPNKYMD